MIEVEIYGGTDRGLSRDNNEDSIGYFQFDEVPICLALVADGVGGHSGGEIASQLAVDEIESFIRNSILQATSGGGYSDHWMEQILVNALVATNLEILQQQQQDPDNGSMATTIVSVMIKDDVMALAHLGDSRCYLWRQQNLERLTKDHTIAQQMLDQGVIEEEQYYLSPYHHVLSRALGLEAVDKVPVNSHSIEDGDIFLLCTDGLTNCLTEPEIREILIQQDRDISACTEELITRSNDAGGVDNVSVVLLKCRQLVEPE